MVAGHEGRAQARARALLLDHLTPEQRREYEATGSFAVVRSGVVWAWCVWKNLLVQGALLVLAAVTVFRAGGGASGAAAVALTVTALLVPRWLRGLRIAFSRRRTWRIAPAGAPTLEIRRKRIDFCVRIDAALPGADQMLAYKNILEANEPYFLRKANARI